MGFNGKGAMTGAMSGASAGMAFGPYGAAIGGVGGLLLGGFGGGDDGGGAAPAGTPYQPDVKSFGMPAATPWFGAGGGGSFWSNEGGFQDADKTGVGWAQAERRSGRAAQEDALGMMKQHATGKKSAARDQSKVATQQAQQAIGSQVASAPGGYNPAAVRAGVQAQAGAGQRIAGQTAIAAAQEQAAARQAYAQGVGQMRGQDVQSQMAEQQWWAQQQQAAVAKKALMAKYLQLGMTDREAQRSAMMAYEQMKFLGSEGQAGRDLVSQRMAMQQSMSDRDYWTKMAQGGMGALSDSMAAYYKSQGTGGGSGSGGGGGGSGAGGLGNASPWW